MTKERNVEIDTLAKIQLIKGRSHADMDALAKILVDNYSNRKTDRVMSTLYEDSVCPPNPIVDEVIEEMKVDFEAVTGEKIINTEYWGHIHEKNMSTNTHNHNNTYAAGVLYVQVPEGSGSITFTPAFNQYHSGAIATTFKPELGVYYMFPGYLDHFVTRNKSEEKRVSISFNFKKKNPD